MPVGDYLIVRAPELSAPASLVTQMYEFFPVILAYSRDIINGLEQVDDVAVTDTNYVIQPVDVVT